MGSDADWYKENYDPCGYYSPQGNNEVCSSEIGIKKTFKTNDNIEFSNASEAQAYAKDNPGAIVVRSGDGKKYILKNSSSTNEPLTKDENWIQIIWDWADKNKIWDRAIPRNKQKLISLTSLSLNYETEHKGCSAYRYKDIPKEIGNLTNLRELNLRGNELTALPIEISNLRNLRKLDLSKNYLSSLPKEIYDLTHLEELDLSSNKFSSLPKEIANLINLKSISLSSNKFAVFPINVCNIINLSSLNFKDNSVDIPPEIGQLKNLKELFLGSMYYENNKIKEIPKEIGQLLNLERLFITDTQITSLPKEIGNLKNLNTLYLMGRKLTSLPKEIGNLSNLTHLHLQYNPIIELPNEITNLTNLIILQLSDKTKINAIQKKWLEMLYNEENRTAVGYL